MNSKYFKFILFIILIIILLFIVVFSILGFSYSYLSIDQIKEHRSEKSDLINSFKINSKDTIRDIKNNIFYYSISDDYENNRYILKLNLKAGYKYKIVGKRTNIIKVNYNKPINIIIYNSKYYFETKIVLTNLPIVSINGNETITKNDIKVDFKYMDPSKSNTLSYNSKIHVRGDTSSSFPKKSYKADIYNKNYSDTKKIYMSKFYNGSAFILDAVYRDPSKMRNVLATDIWNNISSDFNNVKIYSEYVEVFINGEYKGLYVLTEPINRTKLNLEKSGDNSTSVIIKTVSYDMDLSKYKKEKIDSADYLGYIIKYPNDEAFYEVCWDRILKILYKYYNNDIENSDEIIESTFNINNYVDLAIFNSFINNLDSNFLKNNYIYLKDLNDDKVYIQPWDMEYSFGIKFSSSSINYTLKSFDDYKKFPIELKKGNANQTNKLITKRYWKLRESVLTENYIYSIIDKYYDKLSKGAALRDSNKWEEYNLKKEVNEIKDWIKNRFVLFDKYVKDLENE